MFGIAFRLNQLQWKMQKSFYVYKKSDASFKSIAMGNQLFLGFVVPFSWENIIQALREGWNPKLLSIGNQGYFLHKIIRSA